VKRSLLVRNKSDARCIATAPNEQYADRPRIDQGSFQREVTTSTRIYLSTPITAPMADVRGKAWPLADADLTNSVSLLIVSSSRHVPTIYLCIMGNRSWSSFNKPANTSSLKREPTKVFYFWSVMSAFSDMLLRTQPPKHSIAVFPSSSS
jgi:hypothetical protein